jgi:hypothetical protein
MHRSYPHHAGRWLTPFLGLLALAVFPAGALAAPPTNTAPPTITIPPGGAPNEITGASVGRSLTSTPGTWSPQQSSYKYQWTQDCVPSAANPGTSISGAINSTYKIADTDVNHTLCLTVSAGGSAPVISSTQTSKVVQGTPIDRAAPTMSGVTQDGQTLTANHGSWDGTQPISYAYQWRRCAANGKNCGASVTGPPSAANVTYVLGDSDVGHTISVVVTASNSALANTYDPNPVALGSYATATVVTPGNTAAPKIVGTPQQGNTLTASHGSWLPGGSTLADQWESCDASGAACVAIPGATEQTYQLTPAGVGHTVVVQETASDNGATSSAASVPTGVVQAAPSTGGGSSGNPGGGSGGNPGGGSGGKPSGGQPTPTGISPSPGVVKPAVQLRGLLINALAVHGQAAQIRALLKRGGYSFTFTAPSAGRLAISWYGVQHRRKILVATVNVRLRRTGKAKIELTLTRKGRNLLKGAGRMTLAAQGGFTPVGQGTTSASRTIKLLR